MSDYLSDAVARVQAADDAAYASQLAFMLGPDEYLQHIESTYQFPDAEAARQRIEDEYRSLRPDTPDPTPTGTPTGSSPD